MTTGGNKTYRNWFFNSLGDQYAARTVEQNDQTFSLTATRDDGKTTKTSLRYEGPDREVWHTQITDPAGKVYVDMDSTITRRKDK